MNLWCLSRELDFIKQFSENNRVKVKILLFSISEKPEICYKRVEEDLNNGVDRSRTINVKAKDGLELIYSMSNRYKKLINDKQFYDLIKLYSESYPIELKTI